MVVLAGDDQDLRARAGVEGLAGGQRPEPGHGQALVLAAGHRARAAPALDAAAVQLVVHMLVHREAVVFYPAIWKAHRKSDGGRPAPTSPHPGEPPASRVTLQGTRMSKAASPLKRM